MSSKSIGLLNKSVADELQAVHQYMYFHFHLDDQGFGSLAKLFKRTAIIEMGHVEALADRILFLKGDVEMMPSSPVEKLTEPATMLAKAIGMEQGSVHDYNRAAQKCGPTLTPHQSSCLRVSCEMKKAIRTSLRSNWKTSSGLDQATSRFSPLA